MASQWPEHEAIATPEREAVTYRRLLDQVTSLVDHLHRCGIGRNDRVAVVLPNGPEMAIAFLATAAGATSAPLNPNYRASEFEFYLTDLGAKALIALDGPSPAVEVARALGVPVLLLSPDTGGPAGGFTLSQVDTPTGDSRSPEPGDTALLLHTSGTTARPKIVPLTQANLCASAGNIRNTLGLTDRDRCLNVMPLFHIHGLMGALLSSLGQRRQRRVHAGLLAPQFFDWMESSGRPGTPPCRRCTRRSWPRAAAEPRRHRRASRCVSSARRRPPCRRR